MTRGAPPTQAEFHAAIAERADRWYGACLRITRSPELAEDAVQEALMSAWEKREQFHGDARLSTWIHTIAVNAALQLVRRQRPGAFSSLDIDVADAASQPDEDRHQYDVGVHLGAALASLSEMERVCFVLKHMEQWRAKEIASELDCNEGNVKQAVFRAVRKLRDALPDLRSEAT